MYVHHNKVMLSSAAASEVERALDSNELEHIVLNPLFGCKEK